MTPHPRELQIEAVESRAARDRETLPGSADRSDPAGRQPSFWRRHKAAVERGDRRRGRGGVRLLRRAATRRSGPDAEAVAARRRVVAGARRRAGGAVLRRINRAVPRSVRRARQRHRLERKLADHAGGGSGHQGGSGRGRWWDRAHGLGVARLRPVRGAGRRRDGLLRDPHLRRLHGGDSDRGVWAVPRLVLRQRSCRHDADSGRFRDCRDRDRAVDAVRRRAGREVPASAGRAVERTRGGQVATNCHPCRARFTPDCWRRSTL